MRASVRLAVLSILLSLVLTSCVAPAPVAVEPEPAAGGGGGDLIIAMPGELEREVMDRTITGDDHVGMINSYIADSLVCRNPETGLFDAWLATSWEPSEDGLEWTFQLRDDVTFHDGTKFNAEAVKYNFERILDPETKSGSTKARIGPITDLEVLDKYTIKVTHETPYAAFLDSFSFLAVPMWSPTAAEKYGLSEFPQHLTGSGPFIFEEQVIKSHFKVVRNPDYNWAPACLDHTGPALLDSVTWKWVDEEAVLGGVLKSGEAHLVGLPAQYVDEYQADPGFEVLLGYQAGTGLIWHMNTVKFPLDDIRVRQAILHTVDRDSINQILFDGKYLPSYGPLTPVTPGYWEGAETMYPLDVDKANALLDEAGWTMNEATGFREKDGQSLKVIWAAIHHVEIGEALAAQLKAIGMEFEVAFVPGTLQKEMMNARSFDMMYYRLRGTDLLLMDTLWNPKYSGIGGNAITGFNDARLGELLDSANVEPDQDKRTGFYIEAQKIIMENALCLGTFDAPMFWAYTNDLKGFMVGPSAVIYYPYMLTL